MNNEEIKTTEAAPETPVAAPTTDPRKYFLKSNIFPLHAVKSAQGKEQQRQCQRAKNTERIVPKVAYATKGRNACK